ncbi:hypothetical protein VLK31_28350 [Variovorax sp. H27-G14]|uniref:hypothetical protein n=1 Tax=Variovorax sp. H27-G14 TaxID=3111914 RepID=UPI0038FCE8E5
MKAFGKTFYETSKLLLRQMQQPERGEAMFAPTNTASMKNHPVKDRTSHGQG